MQILHHVLTKSSSLNGKFDLKGSATILKILPSSCPVSWLSWLLSYVNDLSKTRTHGNLLGPNLRKVGCNIFSSKRLFFRTRLYSKIFSRGSCPYDVKYAQLESSFVVGCSLNSLKGIRGGGGLWPLMIFKFESAEKISFK